MKLIIDIPEDLYKWIKDTYDNPNGEVAYSAIASGTPYNPTDKNDCKGCFHYTYDGDIPYCELGYSIQGRCKEFRMSLPATIEHYKEKAKKLKEEAEIYNYPHSKYCKDCAEEHEQLAKWLEELRELRTRRPVCSFDGYVVYKKLKGIVEY